MSLFDTLNLSESLKGVRLLQVDEPIWYQWSINGPNIFNAHEGIYSIEGKKRK